MQRREMAADLRAVAEHGAVDHRPLVDGMRERATHPDIVEGRARVVDGEDGLALGRADHRRIARIVLELRHGLGRGKVCKGEIGRAQSELQSLMRISYAVFCLKKKQNKKRKSQHTTTQYH